MLIFLVNQHTANYVNNKLRTQRRKRITVERKEGRSTAPED
jgi:hypothetical protein